VQSWTWHHMSIAFFTVYLHLIHLHFTSHLLKKMNRIHYIRIPPPWQEGDSLLSLLQQHVSFIFHHVSHAVDIKARKRNLTIIQTTSDKAIQLVKSVKLSVRPLKNLTRNISRVFLKCNGLIKVNWRVIKKNKQYYWGCEHMHVAQRRLHINLCRCALRIFELFWMYSVFGMLLFLSALKGIQIRFGMETFNVVLLS